MFLDGVGINGKLQGELSKALALDTDKPGSDRSKSYKLQLLVI